MLGSSEREEGTISQMRGPKTNVLQDLDGAVKTKTFAKQELGVQTGQGTSLSLSPPVRVKRMNWQRGPKTNDLWDSDGAVKRRTFAKQEFGPFDQTGKDTIASFVCLFSSSSYRDHL